MLNHKLLVFKTIFIISILKSVYSWSPQCSPCRCFDQSEENPVKISDCSNSVTGFQLTKIPQLNEETESVFFIGQHLEVIPEDAFLRGSKNKLKFVDLKNCKVRSIHVNAFRNLQYLSGLDLSHNELSNLNENIFGSNDKLRILILQHNNIRVFPEKIFDKLLSLKYLDISDNKLHYIFPNQFEHNLNLERLIIQTNYLTTFDNSLISHLHNLNVLYMDNNPWKCDCQTRDLQKLIIDRKINFVYNDIYPLCSKPKQWKGRKWLEVQPKDLCSVEGTPGVQATEGIDFEVNCTIDTTTNLAVEWLLNGQSLDTNNNNKYQLSSVRSSSNTFLYKLKINDVGISDKGTYKCWTSDAKGSDIQYEETVLDVTPGIKPQIRGQQNTTTFLPKGSKFHRVNCDVSGTPLPEVEWLFNGEIISLPTYTCKRVLYRNTNDIIIEQLDPICFGKYTCRAKSSVGVAEKNYDLVLIPDNVQIEPVANIDNNNAYESSFVTINCLVSEAVKVDVQWLRNNEIITPNDIYSTKLIQINATHYNYTLTINDISDNQNGNYKCRANSIESPEFTINVKQPEIDFSLGDNENELTLGAGDYRSIPCKLKGNPKATVIWQFPQPNCNEFSYAKDGTLFLENVSCGGRYKCVITTSKRRIEKDFNLSVVTAKIVNVSLVTNYWDNIVYEHEEVILTCLVEDASATPAYWIFNNNIEDVITNSANTEIIIKPAGKNRFYYNLKIKDVNTLNTGKYGCMAGNAYKELDLLINKGYASSILNTLDDETFVEAGTKNFELPCETSGAHPNINWIYNTTNLCKYDQIIKNVGDRRRAVLIIKETHPSCIGQYKCLVDNQFGRVEKDVNLNIVSLQPPSTGVETSFENNEVVEDEEIVLKCLIRGAVKSEPKWVFNGKLDPIKHRIVKEEISHTSYWYNLAIRNLKQEDAGNYKCVIGNHEQTISVKVKPSSRPTIEYISHSQNIETGRKNFQIVCKVTRSSSTTTTWLKHGNTDGCTHEITREVVGNHEWIYLIIPEVTSSCSGRYTCVASNSKGEQKRNLELSVISSDEPPVIDIESLSIDNQVIENENVTLKCLIKNNIFEPVWVHKGHAISNNNKYKIERVPVDQTSYLYNLVIFKISPQERGSYKCRVNNIETETIINVQPSKKPVIEYISNPKIVEEGKKDFRLSCKINGIPKPKVYWHFEGKQITKQSSNKFNCEYTINSEVTDYTEWLYLTIRNVEQSCAGKYKCVAENMKGDEENEINLSVVSTNPPEIIPPPKDIIENGNVTLQCLIKGIVDSKPSWSHNNRRIESNNKYKLIILPIHETSYWYNLEITNISPYDRGNYKCKINNQETEINLQIQPGRKPVILETPPTELLVEEGTKEVILTCQVDGNPIPENIWLYENIPIDQVYDNNCQYRMTNYSRYQVNLIIKNVDPTCAGKYKCVSKNIKGSVEKVINVKVPSNVPPTVQLVPTTGNQIVEHEEVTLKCLVPNKKYPAEWYRKDELVVMEPNGKYSITFEPVNETAYWFNLVISDLLLSDKGEYKCRIHNSESTITLDVEKSSKPIIEYSPTKDTFVSEGTKDFRLACKVSGVPKPQVSWQYEDNSVTSRSNCKHEITSEVFGNSEWLYLTIAEVTPSCAGIYKCVTINSVGTDQTEINLLVSSSETSPQIPLTSTPTDIVARENNDATLRCLSTGNFNSMVQWYHNKKNIDTSNENKYQIDRQKVNQMTTWHILTIKNVSLNNQGEYTCRINNAQQTFNLEIQRALIPTVEYFTNPELIIDEETEETVLPCKVTDVGEYKVEWLLNGKPLDESNCASESSITYEEMRHFEWYNLTIEKISTSCSGEYKCNIKNLKNEDDNIINVTVLPVKRPEINITSSSSDDIIREQDSVSLKCLITSSNTNTAKWIYKGQEIRSNDKYKITKLIINQNSYWYNLDIPSVTLQESGDYKCSTDASEIVQTLVVMPGFKPIIEHISNTEMIVEESAEEVTLFCKAKGSPAPTIRWAHQSRTTIKPGNCRLESTFEKNSNSQWNYLTISKLNPTCSGKFVCFAKNQKGYASQFVNLTIIPTKQPEITLNTTSPDNIIREGDDITISCLATGKNTVPAKWFFKAKYGDNDKGNFKFKTYEINPLTYRYDLIIKNITFEQAGRYVCKKNAVENHINIQVNPGNVPEIEQISSENVVIYTGTKSTTLFCKVSGVPKPEVTWLYNGKSLSLSKQCKYEINENNHWYNLTILDVTPSCIGYYKCSAKTFKGVTEKEVTVKVIHPQKPETKINVNNGNDNDINNKLNIIKENDKVTLTCLVKGDFNTPVQWLSNGKVIKIDNKNYKIIKQAHDDISFWYNLQIEKVSLGHKGNYQCKTPNSQSDITLNVYSITKPTVKLEGPAKIFVQSGTKELSISCTKGGTPIPSGTWQYNNNLIDRISLCSNGCQYETNNSSKNSAEFILSLKNITTSCSGRYKCISENSIGKAEAFVDVVVIPPGQPKIHIPEPVYAKLYTDVTINCEITSVDQPDISWKCLDKNVNSNRQKYITSNVKGANNVHYSKLTIRNFQPSDMVDYTCQGQLHNLQNFKTISLKPRQKIKPTFYNPLNLWENFEIINGDIIFTTKVRSYPPPNFEWSQDYQPINYDKSLRTNTKYLSEVSYIGDDQYWFNQTIKNFDSEIDSGTHVFTVKNEIGNTTKEFYITINQPFDKPTGRIEIFVDPANTNDLPMEE